MENLEHLLTAEDLLKRVINVLTMRQLDCI